MRRVLRNILIIYASISTLLVLFGLGVGIITDNRNFINIAAIGLVMWICAALVVVSYISIKELTNKD